MKILNEIAAMERLAKIKARYRDDITTNFEHKAKNCLTCEVQGACCTDAHFVNVHITRLEAVAIDKDLGKFDDSKREEIFRRIAEAVEDYGLTAEGDTFGQTFSCPLFEKGTGCLVHSVKPVPCIQHACYENKADLPPDEMQENIQAEIERLNRRAYLQNHWLPLPLQLLKLPE